MALIFLVFSMTIRSGDYEIVASPHFSPFQAHELFTDLKHAEKITTDFFKLHPPRLLRIVVCPTTYDFCTLTGMPYWRSARTVDSTIILQPLGLLDDRQIAQTTVTHEFVHFLLRNYKLPLWLNEGLAVYLSGEIKNLVRSAGGRGESNPATIEYLLRSSNPDSVTAGYLGAYRQTKKLIDISGREGILKLINKEGK